MLSWFKFPPLPTLKKAQKNKQNKNNNKREKSKQETRVKKLSPHFLTACFKQKVITWHHQWNHSVVVITIAQLHSTKPELRFCAGSNPARSVSEIRDGEDLWQWSRLEIRLNAFRRSTIPQKQFIIIIIIIITIINMFKFFTEDSLILPNQSGFKPSHSYTNQLLSITHQSYKPSDDGHEAQS